MNLNMTGSASEKLTELLFEQQNFPVLTKQVVIAPLYPGMI